jgi:hypothetical protein
VVGVEELPPPQDTINAAASSTRSRRFINRTFVKC